MKYLYPYECATKNLSTPDELQTAIEGNRREGRSKTNYAAYGAPPSSVPPASLPSSGVIGDTSHFLPSTVPDSRTTVNSIGHNVHNQISSISLVTAALQHQAVAAAAANGTSHPLAQNFINGSVAHSPINSQLRNTTHQPTTGSATQMGKLKIFVQ